MTIKNQLPQVENMLSPTTGKPVANQFQIYYKNKTIFQSYNRIIAVKYNNTGKVVLDEKYWCYSVTTSKYRRKFLRDEGIAETRLKIASDKYKLKNLN